MRKPRDINAELATLIDKTKTLKEKKTRYLGELVAATGADALDIETLAGGLLALVEAADPNRKESWRQRGQAFFQRRTRDAAKQAAGGDAGSPLGDSGVAEA